MTTLSDNQHIITYYDTTEADYKLVWHLDSRMAMHFGFWDKGIHRLRDALWQENKVLAEMAQVSAKTRVLDAGCGVGGSAIYLAQHFGSPVTGISLSQKQIATCQANAARCNVANKTTFLVADYTKTGLPAGSFDVVWAIESVCHAPRKQDFTAEAYRLLVPGGRLIVADYFLTKAQHTVAEQRILDKWVDGWKMNPLVEQRIFAQELTQAGFTNVQYEDASTRVLPSLRRLYRMSLPATVGTRLAQAVRLRSATQTGNVTAAHNQYKAMRRGLWQYGIFLAVK